MMVSSRLLPRRALPRNKRSAGVVTVLLALVLVELASAFGPTLGLSGLRVRIGIEPTSPAALSSFKLQATKISDWSKLKSPPPKGRRTGPNWTVDPETLDPKYDENVCGTLVWAIPDESVEDEVAAAFVYPERRTDLPVGQWLAKRRNLGIAMSGGGLRAATCALGWFRALHHEGILSKARYFTANSGATWTALPLFSKQVLEKKEKRGKDGDIDYDAYLGKHKAPQDITMHEDEYGSMGKVLHGSNVRKFKPVKKEGPYNDWCASIRQNYFSPVLGEGLDDFWLDICNAHFWNTPNTAILNDYHTLPFPIYIASCSEDITDSQVFPFEMTPIYTGIPVDPGRMNPNTKLGGGFIQGVGFNAPGSSSTDSVPLDNSAHYLVDLHKPSPVVKLFQLTGASSNFGAAADAVTTTNLSFLPGIKWLVKILGIVAPGEYTLWSPNKGGAESAHVELVDGGLLDNLGILTLLRRKCSTIIACYSSGNDVDQNEDDWTTSFGDVAALFGYESRQLPKWISWLLEKKSYRQTIAKRSQVFEKEELGKLIKDLIQCKKEGKPAVVRKTMTVLVNRDAGIFESFPVDMIWCFSSNFGDWESVVSDAGKKADVDKDFPHYATINTDYSKNDVNMLAHLCSYQLLEGLKNVNFKVDEVPF